MPSFDLEELRAKYSILEVACGTEFWDKKYAKFNPVFDLSTEFHQCWPNRFDVESTTNRYFTFMYKGFCILLKLQVKLVSQL